MTGDLFAETLGRFIKFIKISKSNPGLLLMDNHISHLSIEAIDMAKENGLCLFTFPPHCSHKLQSLDIGVYGPFKRYYSSFCDSWMTSNPGKPLSIYKVAELLGHAFHKAFTIENITSFRSSGIHPFNLDVFPNNAFLPALVTDIFLQLDEADSSTAPSTTESAIFTNVAEPQTLNDEELFAEINPYPKANVLRKRPNKRRCKSAIITDTPEKEKLVSRCKKVSQKWPERTVSSSSESDISMHLLSDSTSDNESSTSTISAIISSRGSVKCHIKIGNFAVVKVFSAEGKHKNFIGKICNGPDEDGDYEVNFMKQSEKIERYCICFTE